MKWNQYAVTNDSGNRYEIMMGEWLKPGKYSFGTVTIIESFDEEKTEEYFKIEQEIYDIWYDVILPKEE